MMNLIKSRVLTVLIFSVILFSCNKESLDKYPYNNIELSQSFKTVLDAKTWNNGLYSNLRGRVGGIYTYATDVQADQLNASQDFGNRSGNPHRWEGFLAEDVVLNNVWANNYRAITNANIMLNGFTQITPANATETTQLNRYKGDAHLVRAYYFHQLVKHYAKAYNPATAASDLGVPLVLNYDVSAQPARATVKEVYDQILADLGEAKTLLAGVPGVQGSIRFTEDVVNALEARVKLNMQDWAGAKTAAELVINKGTYPLINTGQALKDYWHKDTRSESILQFKIILPNELTNTNSIYLGYVPASGRFTPDFIPSQWVVDLYEDKDIRKDVYFAQLPVTIQVSNFEQVWLVNKFPGNPALFTGANTNYLHEPKVFRVAEMYLIAAEASARMGAGSEASALKWLNDLRIARGLDALTGISGDALLEAIKTERTRELAFEGFRLNDLKRWNEGFTRRDPQNTGMLYTGPTYTELSIPANHPKFVWGIPTNDVTINKNLVQNPGW